MTTQTADWIASDGAQCQDYVASDGSAWRDHHGENCEEIREWLTWMGYCMGYESTERNTGNPGAPGSDGLYLDETCCGCNTGSSDSYGSSEKAQAYLTSTGVTCTAADCSDHGTPSFGLRALGCSCECNAGWSGSDCETPTPCDAEQHCNGQGVTNDKNSNDGCVCSCDKGFMGPACGLKMPCTSPTHCSSQGMASGNVVDGCSCECSKIVSSQTNSKQYEGDQCETLPQCNPLGGKPARWWLKQITAWNALSPKYWYTGLPENWWHGWTASQVKQELMECIDNQCPSTAFGRSDLAGWRSRMASNDKHGRPWYHGLPEDWWHGMSKARVEAILSHCDQK